MHGEQQSDSEEMAEPSATRADAPAERTTDLRVRRPRLLTSLVFNAVALGVLWLAYSTIRTVTADSWRTARTNADKLLAFQDWLGLPSEATVQSLLLDHEWLVRAANVYYLFMHFPSMILFLAWVMLWRREWMPRFRWSLIGATMTGLMIHLAFPLAPPRMLRLSGFVDTAQIFGPDPYALGVAKAANELAAMPSMHVGWALLICLATLRISRHRLRWLVLAHPIITTVVVVVTANHYWTDVIVGGGLALIAWWASGIKRPMPLPELDDPLGTNRDAADVVEVEEIIDLTDEPTAGALA